MGIWTTQWVVYILSAVMEICQARESVVWEIHQSNSSMGINCVMMVDKIASTAASNRDLKCSSYDVPRLNLHAAGRASQAIVQP